MIEGEVVRTTPMVGDGRSRRVNQRGFDGDTAVFTDADNGILQSHGGCVNEDIGRSLYRLAVPRAPVIGDGHFIIYMSFLI